jgi:heme/copper-type cytochrome/quinol oxidase subunit 1
MSILKQHKVKGIGNFIHVLYLTTPLFGAVSYIMGAITMYTVILPWTKVWMPWLSMPLFLGICFVACSILVLMFYCFVYPSYMAFQNKQQYIHENPIQKDLALIKTKLGIKD